MLSMKSKCTGLQWHTFSRREHHFVSNKWKGFANPRFFKESTVYRLHPLNLNTLRCHSYRPQTPLENRGFGFFIGCGRGWCSRFSRVYSSKGDDSSNNGSKQVPVKDAFNFNQGKDLDEKFRAVNRDSNIHVLLGEQDQKEWLEIERLSFESQKKESPFLTKKEKFRNEFLRRVIPWENIRVSWDTFPYYISERVKSLLMECAAARLKHKEFASSYGDELPSSCGRIFLHSLPEMPTGGELYKERVARALSRELRVPLLVLDGSLLVSHGFYRELTSESDVDDENAGSSEEFSDAEDEADNDVDSNSEKSDSDEASAEALTKIVPISIEEFAAKASGDLDSENTSTASQSDDESSEQLEEKFSKGDRVKYVGASVKDGERILTNGLRGEVYDVDGNRVAVIIEHDMTKVEEDEKKKATEDGNSSLYWIDVRELVTDDDIEAQSWFIALQALKEVLTTVEPLIVYFGNLGYWLQSIPQSTHKDFLHKLQEILDELTGSTLFICGQNIIESSQKEKDKMVIFPQFARMDRLPATLQRLAEGLQPNKVSRKLDLRKIFNNLIYIDHPKDEEMLRTFHKQLEEDGKIIKSRINLVELHKVLLSNNLSCMDLLRVKTDGVTLVPQKARRVVGWARNHYLSSCTTPVVKGDRLNLPQNSLEVAIGRLRDEEACIKKPSQNLKAIAKDEYESNFVSAVVPPGEIRVTFDDIGALEDVKRTLHELVTLPMRRPELFAHGNLLRPCKGILLFGPPGTGKTLLAKALSAEAEANFISVTGSILTSKWFGDAEKLAKALFSFASKLAPVVIFVDEIDSLLGARGGAHEHDATRRMRNEFMAAWDGLRSKESQRILLLGATNRPFDLDDAVIRRLPRRIYVGLPNSANRVKILKIFLAQENLEHNFSYDELAMETEGYSGSDLKNLCVAAAYRPVQELLEEEKKAGMICAPATLRPLNVDDFLQAKSKVGPSVAYDATSMNELRKWNEQYGEGGSRRRSPVGFGGHHIDNTFISM